MLASRVVYARTRVYSPRSKGIRVEAEKPAPSRWALRGTGRASGATGYARLKAQWLVAFLTRKKTKHPDKKRIARALAQSSRHADVRRVAFFPAEVRVFWGSASQVCFSPLSLGVEERFNAQTIRSSAT
jgi:hypothetical protein